MSQNLKIAKKGEEEVKQYLKKQGYERIEKSRSKDHDLDAWKNWVKYTIEVKTRTMTRIPPTMPVSTREYKLLESDPSHALLIIVCLDKHGGEPKIREYKWSDIDHAKEVEYRLYFKKNYQA
jgi:hypothetical protein